MVAMPYILVDIVLGMISLAFFATTSAALLAARRSNHRIIAYALLTAVLLVGSMVLAFLVAKIRQTHLFSPFLFDILFGIALINSVVLAYQFLSKRYFLNMATLQRRLMIGTLSVVLTLVPALAVIIAVVGLFVIR
jgi:hypothetical protein